MIITSIADFCLQHDAALGLLRLEWVSGPDTRTLRASAGQLLALARDLAVRHLLLDLDTVPDILVYDQPWLGTHWMPGIVQLPLERVVLVIGPHRVHNQLAVDALHDLVQPSIRFDWQYFSAPEPALHWLTDGSPRLPALLAEWAARSGPSPAGSAGPPPFTGPGRSRAGRPPGRNIRLGRLEAVMHFPAS